MADGSHVHFQRVSDTSNGDQFLIDYFTPIYREDPNGQRITYTHEQIPGTFDFDDIRVRQLTDSSGRSLTFTYESITGVLSQVTASTGQWVKYTWQPFNSPTGRQVSRVDYSDGTSASYTYARVPVIGSDGTTGTLPKLVTAQDTRAMGPMRSIQYQYTTSPQKDFPGEIKAERHLGDGVLVSAFAHDSGRTSSTDTRGDGPSRTFNMQKVGGIPLVTSKSDFS